MQKFMDFESRFDEEQKKKKKIQGFYCNLERV